MSKILEKRESIETPSEYAKLSNYINMLNKPSGDFNNEYFQCVYGLQDTSAPFKMVWNDFNYYNSIVKPTEEELIYLNRLRQYVYQEVRNYHISKQEKNKGV